jgi:uncharacterized membrane protein YoaK (UPF0700 family)
MKKFNGPGVIANLLSFNGGYVDTAGFLGLQGLFTAHVTGNFVTLGAALVLGSHGVIGKLLALPEFILVVALARMAGAGLRLMKASVLRTLLVVEVILLAAYFALAVIFGPFADADQPLALVTGFAGIAAMALQNAVQRVHLASSPPTTIMTGNTTQATLDIVDLITGNDKEHAPAIRARFVRTAVSIGFFATGCGFSALLYWLYGFWCLALPVIVGAIVAILRAEAAPAA